MTQHNINWKQLAAAFTSVLTLSAALPYSLGELAIIIPPKFKGWVVLAGLVATTILRTLNAVTVSLTTCLSWATTASTRSTADVLDPAPFLHPCRRCVETSDDVIRDKFISISDSRILDFSIMRLGAAKG